MPLPSIVMPGDAGPLIVSTRPVICGNVLANEIVPATLNPIVSLPLPAAQPFVAVSVFAAVIASRRTQMPGAPVSASEVTAIVAARAVVLKVSAKATAIAAASTARILSTALVPATAFCCRAAAVHLSSAGRIGGSWLIISCASA